MGMGRPTSSVYLTEGLVRSRSGLAGGMARRSTGWSRRFQTAPGATRAGAPCIGTTARTLSILGE